MPDLEAIAEDLYAAYAASLADDGEEVDPWDDLTEIEQRAWCAVAGRSL